MLKVLKILQVSGVSDPVSFSHHEGQNYGYVSEAAIYNDR